MGCSALRGQQGCQLCEALCTQLAHNSLAPGLDLPCQVWVSSAVRGAASSC